MAGINIELKKIHNKKGYFNTLSTYLFSAVILTGPMLFLVSLLIFVEYLLISFGINDIERELVTVIISNCGMLSVAINSLFIMLIIRYVADCIYEKNYQRILPSFYGGLVIMLTISNIIFFIWSLFLDMTTIYKFIIMGLVNSFLTVWTQMSYVSILKNYKTIFLSYIIGFISIYASILIFYKLFKLNLLISALGAVFLGFTLMSTLLMRVILIYCPKGKGSIFHFIRYFNIHPKLLIIGFCWMMGSLGHNIVSFFGPYGVLLKGGFFYNSVYDWPAFLSYLTILPTTIYFYTFTETSFYTAYKEYFNLITTDGIFKEIEVARDKMISLAMSQIFKIAIIQMITTMIFVVAGSRILVSMDPGMFGIFRVLCIGYFFYAIANTIFILALYFDDQDTCFKVSILFFVLSLSLTAIINFNFGVIFFGISYVISSIITLFFILYRFLKFIGLLNFRIFCSQPVFFKPYTGCFIRLSDYLDKEAKGSD